MAEPEQTPEGSTPQPQRRRLGPAPGEEPKGNRAGCLAWGAVLGVLFGIMFALYGLKPILRAIYGEDEVAAGEVFEGDGLTLEWVGYSLDAAPNPKDVPPEGTRTVGVYLDASAEKAWDPAPADVRLEINSQHEWIVSRPATDDGQTSIAPGEFKNLLFVFWIPAESQPFEVEALHIADPRLKMLPPETPSDATPGRE